MGEIDDRKKRVLQPPAEETQRLTSSRLLPSALGITGLAIASLAIISYEPISTDRNQLKYSSLPAELQERVIKLNTAVNDLYSDIARFEAESDGISTGALAISGDLKRITPNLPEAGLSQLPHSLKALSRKLDGLEKQ